MRTAVASLALVLTAGLAGAPCTPPLHAAQRAVGTLTIDSLSGRDTYDYYCAGCHGTGGRGDGPLAQALRTPPGDLTLLASRNGGTFPTDRVTAAVRNTERPITAHGTGEMPVWGTIFDVLDESADRTRARIENVVGYVETLQQGVAPTPDTGRALYRTYCASCHGAAGRGDGAMAPQLKHVVPDLTGYTARNGGVFPSARLEQVIDGRGVASHGTREMPVWGDAFRSVKGGYSPETVKARITAIVRYLEGLQARPAE